MSTAPNLDPGAVLDGHNGETNFETKQRFEIKRTTLIEDRNHRRRATEYIIEDQYLNIYLVFRSLLSDGEYYDVADWVRPGALARYGGFTDALLDDFRTKAFRAFKEEEAQIRKARTVANSLGYAGDGAGLILPFNPGLN